MNNILEDQYKIQPELRDALNRLSEAGKSAVTDMQVVSEAITPLKTFIQVSTNTSGFFKDIDWTNFYKNAFQPKMYTQAVESLSEIQEAAVKRFTESQKEIFETITNDSQNLLKATVSADKPQQAIATYIDKSLDAYDDIKGKMKDQTDNMNSVSSAYMAWIQQTVQSMSEAPAEK